MQTTELNGLCSILITPFDEEERLDLASLRRLVRWTVGAGATALVPLAIMGEAHRMLDAERDEVLGTVVEAAEGEASVVAGCTSESTFVAIARASRAKQLGANAVMLAPPRGTRAGAGLLAHYRAVVESAGLPVVVQDEPVTTGVVLDAEFLGELLEIPGIDHVKVESAPSPPKVSQILDKSPDAICLGGLGGQYVYEELGRGARGVMTGFAMPNVLVRICELYAQGDTEEARSVFYRYLPLIRFEAQLGVGGMAIRKQLLAARGVIDHATVRSPGASTDAKTLAELKDLMEYLGVK